MKKSLIKKYAKLIANSGIGLKKGQPVIVSAPVSAYEFVEILTEELYKAGASDVSHDWGNASILKCSLKYKKADKLKELPEHVISKAKYRFDNSYARVSISSSDPSAMQGLDFKKYMIMQKAALPLEKYVRTPYMASDLQWCVAAIPNVKWAQKVFPNMSKKQAVDALWDAILKACHVSDNNDPVSEWKNHDHNLALKSKILNDYNFKELRYKASNGTNFTIGLVEQHIWAGGAEGGNDKLPLFNPNMPTEEVFTMPHKDKMDGKVVASKPLVYQGNIIEDFYLEFKQGRVINAVAKKGQQSLDALLNSDEGSRSLGEVALVPYDSPISKSNILFYNTLFDENASCHLALGNAYSMNVVDGTIKSEEELAKIGYNKSIVHVDFMIGTSDLSIVGITQDGKEVIVFENGNYAI